VAMTLGIDDSDIAQHASEPTSIFGLRATYLGRYHRTIRLLILIEDEFGYRVYFS
jgi:hypothetical protein